jgi:hypothetical protein
MLTIRQTLSRTLPAVLFLVLTAVLAGPARAGDDVDPKTVARAKEFLNPQNRGRDILSYIHFGAKYHSHAYSDIRGVTDMGKRVPGEFVLVYLFKWEDDGKTEVFFFFDAKGNLTETQIGTTNAQIQQPFVFANVSIKVLGNVLIQAYKEKLTEAERKEVQKLVDDADAKSMMEWSLKLQQVLGK